MKLTDPKTNTGQLDIPSRRNKGARLERSPSPPPAISTAERRVPAKKVRTAWARLGKTMEEFCRQPSRNCVLCMVSEERIVFRNSGDPHHCELRLLGDIIVRELNGDQDITQIVLIKRNGIAYETGGRRLSASMLCLKFLRDQSSGCFAQPSNRPQLGRTIACILPALPFDHPKPKASHIFSPEEVIWILAETAMRPVSLVLKEQDIGREMYEHWREKLSGLDVDRVRYVLNLEEENARLVESIRTLQMDKRMLQESLSRKTGLPAKSKRLPQEMAARMSDPSELERLGLPVEAGVGKLC